METIRFCTQCGTAVDKRIPADDSRPRAVCPACGHIHYSNPKIVVGCLLNHGDKVLLCQRDIEPRIDFWTLPAGYMENRESTLEGALREAREEACAEGRDLRLFATYDLPMISHVYMLYTGALVDGKAAVGEETRAVALLTESEIPWQRLAFPVMNEALENYFADKKQGVQRSHRATFIGRLGSELEIIRATPQQGPG